MNKKLFLAGLFCLVSFALQAQKDDLGLWTSVWGWKKDYFGILIFRWKESSVHATS